MQILLQKFHYCNVFYNVPIFPRKGLNSAISVTIFNDKGVNFAENEIRNLTTEVTFPREKAQIRYLMSKNVKFREKVGIPRESGISVIAKSCGV